MGSILRRLIMVCLATSLFAGVALPGSALARDPYAEHRGFNDEYVFAMTRSVNAMEVNPAFKVTLFPLTVLLDTVFLPFAVIAGFVT